MEFKQVIIVRRDLNMGTGKIAAQVAHAAVMGAEKVKVSRREWFNSWFTAGQAKVDSGLTQIPPGTITCIGIGPAPSELVDKVTHELKLL